MQCGCYPPVVTLLAPIRMCEFLNCVQYRLAFLLLLLLVVFVVELAVAVVVLEIVLEVVVDIVALVVVPVVIYQTFLLQLHFLDL